MAETTKVKTLCDGLIVLNDGTTPTALTYTVALEAGNFTFTPPRKTYITTYDRCDITGSRASRLEPGSLSFSVDMRQFTGSTDGSIIDFIEATGAFSAATTTNADFEGNIREVVYTVEGTDFGDNADHTATFGVVRLWWDFAEGEPNVINITGEILEAPTFTGGTGA